MQNSNLCLIKNDLVCKKIKLNLNYIVKHIQFLEMIRYLTMYLTIIF